MKYAFMSFSAPDLDIDRILQIAKLYGYMGFEPRIGSGHRHGIETDASKPFLKEVRAKMEGNGVHICCLATSCRFADPQDAGENFEHAKRAINLAAEVGSPLIRVFGGSIPHGVSRDRSYALIVEALAKLSEEALKSNVTICMETHDSWCNPEIVAAVMKEINHPAVAVNWDIMHPVLSEAYTVEKSYEVLKPWIRHVHVHDGIREDNKLVFKSIGDGVIDHKAAIRCLKNDGYNGFISGEWIGWEPYGIHLPRELALLKEIEREEA